MLLAAVPARLLKDMAQVRPEFNSPGYSCPPSARGPEPRPRLPWRSALHPLLAALRRLLDVCLLRAGPQDLPYSRDFMILTMAGSLGAGLLAVAILEETRFALLELVLTYLFTVAFLYAVLSFRGLTGRFIQTASAVFGADTIITLVALPALHAASGAGAERPVTGLAMLALGLWNLAVLGHILRHALDTILPVGVLVALSYVIGSLLLVGMGG